MRAEVTGEARGAIGDLGIREAAHAVVEGDARATSVPCS